MADRVSDRMQALYRQPPEAFISARNELAKQLRAEGLGDESKAVGALRKPSVSAWALNQLAARDPEGVASLLDAGAELRAAQQATLSSARGIGRMHAASESRRAAVRRLIRVASEVLSESGRTSTSHLDEVAAGLEAASVEPDAGATLTSGTFERPPAPPVGLGEAPGLAIVPPGREVTQPRSVAKPKPKSAPAPAPASILDAEVKRLRRDHDAVRRTLETDRASAERLAREEELLEARIAKVREQRGRAASRVSEGEAKERAAQRAVKLAETRSAKAVAKARKR